jgi:hypothetical protein
VGIRRQHTDDSRFRQGPFESVGCTGASPDDPFPQLLIPTQTPNATLRFPKGIALRLDARQQVFLNPHMKDFGTTAFQPDIRFNFVKARRGTIKHYAEALTFGNMTAIHIPAGGDQTITAEWTTPIDLTIIHLATHQHKLGTYANIELVSADGDAGAGRGMPAGEEGHALPARARRRELGGAVDRSLDLREFPCRRTTPRGSARNLYRRAYPGLIALNRQPAYRPPHDRRRRDAASGDGRWARGRTAAAKPSR